MIAAGENLGFLLGDMVQKVDPYLRPLYYSFYDIYGIDKIEKMFSQNIIEIASLAFMRGRSLGKCCVILDEAQNTTKEQMHMLLTQKIITAYA